MQTKLFSKKGRIGRGHMLAISIVLSMISLIPYIPFLIFHNYSWFFILIIFLSPFLFWVGIATGCKRCHDLGNSGWFQLIPFYFLWMIFAPGNKGVNKYGPDPKQQTPIQNSINTPYKQSKTDSENEDFYSLPSVAGFENVQIPEGVFKDRITHDGILITDHIFLMRNGLQIGPLSIIELKKRDLSHDDYIWTKGWNDWKQIKNTELKNKIFELKPPAFIYNTPPPFPVDTPPKFKV